MKKCWSEIKFCLRSFVGRRRPRRTHSTPPNALTELAEGKGRTRPDQARQRRVLDERLHKDGAVVGPVGGESWTEYTPPPRFFFLPSVSHESHSLSNLFPSLSRLFKRLRSSTQTTQCLYLFAGGTTPCRMMVWFWLNVYRQRWWWWCRGRAGVVAGFFLTKMVFKVTIFPLERNSDLKYLIKDFHRKIIFHDFPQIFLLILPLIFPDLSSPSKNSHRSSS